MLQKFKNYLRQKPLLRKLKDSLSKKIDCGKYPQSWPSLQQDIKKYAAETGVISEVHDADYLFHLFIKQGSFKTHTTSVQQYFYDGAKSAKKLSELLVNLGFTRDANTTLLEFASGYGMVTRHLVKELYPIRISSCDIHEQATDFLTSHLKVKTILSQSQPENLKFKESFDVVFALSFFSHMPSRSFGPWLKTLYRAVKSNGYLIFTTHGLTSAKIRGVTIPTKTGIHFQANSEQKDLDVNEYGSSFVNPNYVEQQVKTMLKAKIFSFTSAAWWEHQDLYIIQKK